MATVPVLIEDAEAIVELLGGFMGSRDGFRRAVALRERLRLLIAEAKRGGAVTMVVKDRG